MKFCDGAIVHERDRTLLLWSHANAKQTEVWQHCVDTVLTCEFETITTKSSPATLSGMGRAWQYKHRLTRRGQPQITPPCAPLTTKLRFAISDPRTHNAIPGFKGRLGPVRGREQPLADD